MSMVVTVSSAGATDSPDVERYAVTVWAVARFDPDGTVGALTFSSMAEHPEAFLEKLRPILMRARIAPPLDNGQPATFETGLKVSVLVDKATSGGSFRVLGLMPHPLPIRVFTTTARRRDTDNPPEVFRVTASCTVGVEGRCGPVTVTPDGRVSQRFRVDVSVAFGRWVFEPQKLNGKAIEGMASIPFVSASR